VNDEVLVKVEGVSKKFCRSLKRSLWYGVQDVAAKCSAVKAITMPTLCMAQERILGR